MKRSLVHARHSLLLASLVLFNATGAAKPISPSMEDCETYANVANTAMTAHQHGIPLSKVLDVFGGPALDRSPEMRRVIVEAFSAPIVEGNRAKKEAASSYEALWLKKCLASTQPRK
jgi:hypothetical protein